MVGNRYRETTWPLRLAVVRTAIPPGIPLKSSVVQFPALALRVENGKLIGDFRNRPFSFDLLSREEAARRAQTTPLPGGAPSMPASSPAACSRASS